MRIDVAGLTGKDLSDAVDLEIEQFDEFFQKKLGNSPLAPAERAAIKTFVWYVVHREKTDAV